MLSSEEDLCSSIYAPFVQIQLNLGTARVNHLYRDQRPANILSRLFILFLMGKIIISFRLQETKKQET